MLYTFRSEKEHSKGFLANGLAGKGLQNSDGYETGGGKKGMYCMFSHFWLFAICTNNVGYTLWYLNLLQSVLIVKLLRNWNDSIICIEFHHWKDNRFCLSKLSLSDC